MLMCPPKILWGKIKPGDERDQYGYSRWVLTIDDPTPDEQAAFDKFVKACLGEEATMIEEID